MAQSYFSFYSSNRLLFVVQFQGSGNDANQGVQTLAEIATGQEHERVTQIGAVNVDLSGDGGQAVSLAEATIGPDGQIILTGEDGTQSSMLFVRCLEFHL